MLTKEETMISNCLSDALLKNHLEIYFQPIYKKIDFTISHYEALCRWNHDTIGNIPPSLFIAIAERTGQINDIGKWILNRVINYLLLWSKKNILKPIAINLSPIQFEDDLFFEILFKFLNIYPLLSEYLYLEITESILVKTNYKTIKLLENLKESGVKVYLDDFGTGFSSLSYVVSLPINGIKIDRSFTELLIENEKSYKIVKNIINLCESLSLELIVEGVETEHQLEMLYTLGCDYFQGFYFGKPSPIIESINDYTEGESSL